MKQKDGMDKLGSCVQLRIDPESTPANTVCWESCGYFLVLSTETPEEAEALYNALLTVKDVEAD